MRIAVFSDAHGNITYLERCLSSIAKNKVDRLVFLGDALGYFPTGIEAYQMIQNSGAHMLLGNHEAMFCGILDTSEELEPVYQHPSPRAYPEVARELFALPPFYSLELCSQKILFAHGNPWDPLRGYLYEDSPLLNTLPNEYDYIFVGHTHRPFIRRVGDTTVVNVGSCGLPRDIGNLPSYSLIDTADLSVKMVRVPLSSHEVQALLASSNVHSSVASCLQRGF